MNGTLAPKQTSLLLLALLQTGISAAGLVVEIVAARMIAPYVGMSLYTWTAIIAIVLTGFSVGHWWGGRLAARDSKQALTRVAWTMVAAAVLTAAASQILRLVAVPVLQSVADPLAAITVIASAAFFLPSLFAGVPAPVLAVVAMRGRENSEHALGIMFATGAVGAIVGTLLAGFVFISWLGSALTLQIMAAFYAVAALVLFLMAHAKVTTYAKTAPLVAVAVFSSWHTLTAPPICDVESSYYCIRTESLNAPDQDPLRVMILDHLAHGVSAQSVPTVMYTDHTAMLDALPRMRMGDEPFSSFHIGGGTYSVPRAWAVRGHTEMTVAEIDPQVTKAAVQDFWFDPTAAVVLHKDARAELRANSETYDVIVGDAFTDIAVPAHLVTREFFDLVASRLEDGGVFAMNVVDRVDRMEALAALYRTLSTVFPSVEVWTEATPPQPQQRRVFVLLSSQSDSAVTQVETLTPEPKIFAPLAARFMDDLVVRVNAPVLSDDFAPIDRLMGLDSVLD